MNMALTHLVETILAHAKTQGLTQKALGEKAGVGQVTISRAKSADDIAFITLQRLAEAAGMKIVAVADNTVADKILKGGLFL